jgi:hypothetical protein
VTKPRTATVFRFVILIGVVSGKQLGRASGFV